MTLETFFIEPKTVMMLQGDIGTDISNFLHLLLDPLLFAIQDEELRRIIFSTIIWSCLIICGLVFVVYEVPTVLTLISGPQSQSFTKQNRETKDGRAEAATASASRHQLSLAKSQEEREKREAAVKQTGVTVATKLVKDRELLRLSVKIKNASNSHINMVVVDLNLPSGIDAEVGSFRMQRLGTINAGEVKTADFILRPMGGDPADIGGYVEFLGASYEVSKIPLPVPEMEGLYSE